MRIKPSEEVFALVKSLSRTEKAYFKKLHSGRSSSKLSKAFDRINSFSEYNEKRLNIDLEKHGIIPSTAYKQLLPSIIKALSQYDSGKTDELKLLQLLTSVSVLFNRDKLSLSLSQTEKGIMLAKKGGFLAYEWNFLNWKGKIEARSGSFSVGDEDIAYNEAKGLIASLSKEEDYNYLMRKMSRLLNRGDKNFQDLEYFKSEILRHPILQKDEPNSGFRTQHYTILCASNFYLGKWEEAALEGEKGILRESELQKLETRIYLKQVSLMLNLCNIYQVMKERTKYFQMSLRIANELQTTRLESFDNYVRRYNDHLLMLDFSHQLNTGKLSLVGELIDIQLERFSKRDAPSPQHNSLLNLKIKVLFLQAKYKECQILINETLGSKEFELVEVKNLRWIELLCTFMRKDDGLFESKLRAQKRYLAKNPSGYNWVSFFLDTLQRSFGKSDKEQKEIFQEFDKTIESFRDELRVSFEFELDTWVKSIITGKLMIKLIKEQYLGN